MKNEYRKFTKKYCFWLRMKQKSGITLQERSKAITVGQRRKHAEADYYHNCSCKSKRLKGVLLGFSKALEKINFIKE